MNTAIAPGQAGTYFQLGKVAEKLENLAQAKAYYYQDLEITAQSNDQQGLMISVGNLARFYQETGDNSLLSEVAAMLEMTEGEVKELFDRFNQSAEIS